METGPDGRENDSAVAKDWIIKHAVQSEGWFVAHPDLSVAEGARLKRIGKAVEGFLDNIG